MLGIMERVFRAPSCFVNQPWWFVFVASARPLAAVKAALSRGNSWAPAAPLIVAVLSRRDFDCLIEASGHPTREYFLFATGMAAAYLQLLPTEAGLATHPLAGHNEAAVAEAVGAPPGMSVVTLIIVGRRTTALPLLLSERQRTAELARPARKSADELASIDRSPA